MNQPVRADRDFLPGSTTPSAYVYRHVVSFEETNFTGNVYFTRHIAWQGRCREMFLAEHAPGILDEIANDLHLVTLRVSCEYFEEVRALDELEIRMSLAYLRQHRIGMAFSYAIPLRGISPIAQGFQEIGCMRSMSGRLVPTAPPQSLVRALEEFSNSVGEHLQDRHRDGK